MIKRYALMKLHMILASVVFPITLMFFLAGVFYISDIKPKTSVQEFRIQYTQPLREELSELQQKARVELARLKLAEPLGRAKLKWDSDLDIF